VERSEQAGGGIINLGLVEAAQGKWEEAAEHMHYALQHIGGLATPEQKKGLQERYDNVRGRVAMVTVRTNVPASVIVSSVRGPGPSGEPVFVSEGTYRVDVAAEGHEPQVLEIRVTKGETKEVTVDLKKKAGAEPKPDDVGPPAWLGWVLGGSGLAVAGAGAALLVVGQSKLGDASEIGDELAASGGECSSPQGDAIGRCEEADGLVGDARTFTIAGGVLVGIGAAALVGAIVVWTLPSEEKGDVALRLSPWSDGRGGGFVMLGVY
jgi:hypothetical protein